MSLAVSTLLSIIYSNWNQHLGSKARGQLLRDCASVSDQPSEEGRKDFDDMEAITAGWLHTAVALPTTKRHINFFEDPEPVSSLCNSTNLLKCNCCCYQTLCLSDQLKAKSGTGSGTGKNAARRPLVRARPPRRRKTLCSRLITRTLALVRCGVVSLLIF